MTTYILVGGEERHAQSYAAHIRNIVKMRVTRRSPHVLACFFAMQGEGYDESLDGWLKWYRDNLSDRKIAVASKNNFVSEIKDSDVLYLHGGDNYQLLHSLQRYPEFAASLSGKIIIASSAGANCLSKLFYSRTYDRVIEGLGLLDIGFIAHYQSQSIRERADWVSVERRLRASAGTVRIIKLREGELFVIEYENH